MNDYKKFEDPVVIHTRSAIMDAHVTFTTYNCKLFRFAINKQGKKALEKLIKKNYKYFKIDYLDDKSIMITLCQDRSKNTFPFINDVNKILSVPLYGLKQTSDKMSVIEKLNDDFKTLLDTCCTTIPYAVDYIRANVIVLKRGKLAFNIFVEDPMLSPTTQLIKNYKHYGTDDTV